MNHLVTKLPSDGHQKEPSGDVVVNICGALNNLVTSSSIAARDITFFDGLQKLVAIKNSHDSRYRMKKNIKSLFDNKDHEKPYRCRFLLADLCNDCFKWQRKSGYLCTVLWVTEHVVNLFPGICILN